MMHLLPPWQQTLLRKHGKAPSNGEKNILLNQQIAYLVEINPLAFHNEKTLSERVFYHQPSANIPYKSYIIAYEKEKNKPLSK
jgi:hypothetical protein